jgi:hypothetical protein
MVIDVVVVVVVTIVFVSVAFGGSGFDPPGGVGFDPLGAAGLAEELFADDRGRFDFLPPGGKGLEPPGGAGLLIVSLTTPWKDVCTTERKRKVPPRKEGVPFRRSSGVNLEVRPTLRCLHTCFVPGTCMHTKYFT